MGRVRSRRRYRAVAARRPDVGRGLRRERRWVARERRLRENRSNWCRGIRYLTSHGIFRLAGVGAAAIVAVSFVSEARDQRKVKQYRAWQVVNMSEGKGGSGGRIQAIEELNSDGISLEGVDLAGAWLQGVDLTGARLAGADLSGAYMLGACLEGAHLENADLREVRLSHARMRGADLTGARLDGAGLWDVDLRKAKLLWASLEKACLASAQMESADLYAADLDGADLSNTNLDDADLRGAHMKGAFSYGDETSMERADLRGARLDRAYFAGLNLDSARLAGAVMRETNLAMHVYLCDVEDWRDIADLTGANIYGVVLSPEGFESWAVDSMKAVSVSPDSVRGFSARATEYVETAAALSPTFWVPNAEADAAWGRAHHFISTYCRTELAVTTDYVLETVEPAMNGWGYRVTRAPGSERTRFHVLCSSKGILGLLESTDDPSPSPPAWLWGKEGHLTREEKRKLSSDFQVSPDAIVERLQKRRATPTDRMWLNACLLAHYMESGQLNPGFVARWSGAQAFLIRELYSPERPEPNEH